MSKIDIPKGFYLLETKLVPLPGAIFKFKKSGTLYEIGKTKDSGFSVPLSIKGGRIVEESYRTEWFNHKGNLWEFCQMGWEDKHQVDIAEPVKVDACPEPPKGRFEKRPMKFTRIKRGIHYTDYEGAARVSESLGRFEAANMAMQNARLSMATDMAMDAEEKALDQGNILSFEEYAQLSQSDKVCWDLRGLKKFEYYQSNFPNYYWYENK